MKAFQIKFHLAGETQAKVTLPNAASSHLEDAETHGTEDATGGSLGSALK